MEALYGKGELVQRRIFVVILVLLSTQAFAQRSRYNPQRPGGTSLLVAASDSTAEMRDIADYQCNGTADEAEINLAITEANAAGGGMVFLVQGNYTLTSPVLMRADVVFEGAGSSTVLTMATDVQEIAITNQDRSGGNNNITIRGLQVDGNKENQNNTNGTSDDAFPTGTELYTEITGKYSGSSAAGLGTIDFRNSTGVTIENCIVSEGFPSCIDVAGCDKVIVASNTVFNSGDDCIAINLACSNASVIGNIVHDAGSGSFTRGQANCIEVQDGCFNTVVSGNAIFDAASAGVSVNSHSAAAVCHDVTITGNVMTECLYGVRIQGQSDAIQHHIVISANSIKAQAIDSAKGILCQWATEVAITGNNCNIGDADTVAIGVQFSDTVTNMSCTGNALSDDLGDTGSQSIQFAVSGTFTRFQISGNAIDMGGTGIRLNDNASLVDVNIQNNIVNAQRGIFCDTGVSWAGYLQDNTIKGTTTWFRDDDAASEDNGTPDGVDANIIWDNNIIDGGSMGPVVRTVIRTIDLDDDSSTDDFQFDDDATNSTAQNVDMGALVPAWAEIVSVQLRCFESVGAGTFQVTLGTASAGAQLLAQATVDEANEFAATAATASPVVATTVAAQNVWIQGDPSGNWSDAGSAGRWAVMVTYLDYGSVFDVKNP